MKHILNLITSTWIHSNSYCKDSFGLEYQKSLHYSKMHTYTVSTRFYHVVDLSILNLFRILFTQLVCSHKLHPAQLQAALCSILRSAPTSSTSTLVHSRYFWRHFTRPLLDDPFCRSFDPDSLQARRLFRANYWKLWRTVCVRTVCDCLPNGWGNSTQLNSNAMPLSAAHAFSRQWS